LGLSVLSGEVPSWVLRRYEILRDAFGDKPFRFADAAKVLMEQNKDAWEQVPLFLSELRKAGWLLVESDVRDARQKVYRLE
jgi:hypothetical protein